VVSGSGARHLAARLLKRQPPAEAHALLDEAARCAEGAAHSDRGARWEAPALPFKGFTLAFVLQALSTTRATPEELEQIRKLLDEKSKQGR